MSVTENKAIANLFSKAWNEGDLSVADQYAATDIIDHFENSRGIESFKQVINKFRTAFPDIHLTVEDEIAEEDRVVHRWTMSGTQTGEIMGIPPTNKKATWTGITIDRLAEGKVVERWSNVDLLSVLQQLGVISILGKTENVVAASR